MQRPCINCGTLFPSGSYCGRCRPDYAPERLRGRRWMRKRATVFRRCGYWCERCGDRVAVEVHHIDGDPGNNAMDNLLGVCHDCHVTLGGEKRC